MKLPILVALATLAIACRSKDDAAPALPAAPSAPEAHPVAPPTSSARPSPSIPVAAPSAAWPYPMTGFTALAPGSCPKGSAQILLAVTPTGRFALASGLLFANPELPRAKQWSQKGTGPSGLTDKGIGLYATCAPETCNTIASAYKALVPSSHPEIACGSHPTWGDGTGAVDAKPAGAVDDGPLSKDAELSWKCAYLAACMRRKEPAAAGDPFLECQKAPVGFKTECATKASCEDVLKCAARLANSLAAITPRGCMVPSRRRAMLLRPLRMGLLHVRRMGVG